MSTSEPPSDAAPVPRPVSEDASGAQSRVAPEDPAAAAPSAAPAVSEPEDAVPAAYVAARARAGGQAAAGRGGPRRPTPRERFLSRIEPAWDGPVLLATRIGPIEHGRARAAAAAGLAVRILIVGGGTCTCWVLAATTHDGATIPAAGVVALLGVLWPPLHRGVSDVSIARHGFKYQYLTARTWTGRRSLNLARLVFVLEQSETTTAMDAEGVLLSTANRSARKAIAECAQRWGLGAAAPSRAAARRLGWLAFSRSTRGGRSLCGVPAKLGFLAAAIGVCALLR